MPMIDAVQILFAVYKKPRPRDCCSRLLAAVHMPWRIVNKQPFRCGTSQCIYSHHALSTRQPSCSALHEYWYDKPTTAKCGPLRETIAKIARVRRDSKLTTPSRARTYLCHLSCASLWLPFLGVCVAMVIVKKQATHRTLILEL